MSTMETELFFDSDKQECTQKDTNRNLFIYKCKDCGFVTMGTDEDKCIESRNQHMEKTGHTTQRIW